jgi:hypothetical protein
MRFVDGYGGRNSICGTGLGKYDLAGTCRLCRSKKRFCSGDIVVIIATRVPDRFSNLDRGGKVRDSLRFVFLENLIEPLAIPNIADLKRALLDECCVDDRRETLVEQVKASVRPNIPRSTSHENVWHY